MPAHVHKSISVTWRRREKTAVFIECKRMWMPCTLSTAHWFIHIAPHFCERANCASIKLKRRIEIWHTRLPFLRWHESGCITHTHSPYTLSTNIDGTWTRDRTIVFSLRSFKLTAYLPSGTKFFNSTFAKISQSFQFSFSFDFTKLSELTLLYVSCELIKILSS